MEIFNSRSLTQKQRFNRALIVGIPVSFVLAILFAYIRRYIPSSILLVVMAYLIAMTLQKVGRGVQKRFSILGLILALLAIVISDVVFYFDIGALLDIDAYFMAIRFVVQDDISSVLGLVYRVVGVYVGYTYSRII